MPRKKAMEMDKDVCPDCNGGAEIDVCLTCGTDWREYRPSVSKAVETATESVKALGETMQWGVSTRDVVASFRASQARARERRTLERHKRLRSIILWFTFDALLIMAIIYVAARL